MPVLVGSMVVAALAGTPVLAMEPSAGSLPAVEVAKATTSAEERSDGVSAMVSARASETRVEDVSQRTESTQTFANPDGTWSTEMATGPERVQEEDGSWTDIDTTLARNGEGEWVPQATAAAVSFSDGGSEPFAVMAPTDSSSFGVAWPQALPEPVVSGSTLTYPNVVPGGDLVVEALPGGFSHRILLHQAPTEPVEYSIPLELHGLSLMEQANGAISVQTSAGREVASAPAPLMWDHEDGPGGDPETVAPLTTTVDGTGADAALVLTPDMEVLTDPATQYPVTLDPTFSHTPFRDVWVQNAAYTSGQVGSPELRAGTYDGGGHKARSFVDFDTTNLNGKHILSATLKLRNFYSGSCNSANIRANAISETWNKDTLTWANQPDVYSGSFDDYANAYGATGCPEAGWAQWNVLDMVRNWTKPVTDGGWVNRGIRLKAVDETNNASWRKYRSANYNTTTSFRPHLEVTYNTRPRQPDNVSIAPTSASSANILFTKSATPTLSANVSDPDLSQVRGYFEVWTAAGTLAWSGESELVSSGSKATVLVPATKALEDGTTYTVKVSADDEIDRSTVAATATFKVDTSAPPAPGIASNAYAQGTWHDPAPTANTFTLTGPDDAALFSYSKNQGPWVTMPATNGQGTLDWSPKTGLNNLRVKTTDEAGNTGPQAKFTFGTGGAGLDLPIEGDKSTSTFPVSASAPAGATNARVEWRPSGASAWEDAGAVIRSESGATWSGDVASSSGSSTTPDLIWNADAEGSIGTPALVELRVCFTYTASLTKCTQPHTVVKAVNAFDDVFPGTTIGPVEIALFTGEASVTQSDASGLARTFSSFDGPHTGPQVFGPGWSSALSGVPSVIDHTGIDGTITLLTPSGSRTYRSPGGDQTAQAEGDYVGIDEAATDGSSVQLTKLSDQTGERPKSAPEGSTHSLTLSERSRATTTWYLVGGEWLVDRVRPPIGSHVTEFEHDGQARVTWIITNAASEDGNCNLTVQDPGCTGLKISYRIDGHVDHVDQVSYDPAPGPDGLPGDTAGVRSETVAQYAYDSMGRLERAWDPRQDLPDGSHLATTYTYTSFNGRTLVSSIAPPAQAPWRLVYDASGRLAAIKRTLAGTSDDEATWTVCYDVPVAGPGLPDLSETASKAWGQEGANLPAGGVAVFAPDHVPAADPDTSDWAHSQVWYMTESGWGTNFAEYGAGRWLVDTSWFDDAGNITRDLFADGRARALDEATDPVESSSLAYDYSFLTDFSDDGRRIEDEYEPLRMAMLDDGHVMKVRPHLSYVYDDEASTEAMPGRPTSSENEPLDLVIEERNSAASFDFNAEYDVRVTRFEYAPLVDGDGDGWHFGFPTRTKLQLEDGSWITNLSRFDKNGLEIETLRPGATVDDFGAGADSRGTRTVYYTADSSAIDPLCRNKPAWDGMVCRVAPSSQPGTGPAVPTTHILGYSADLQPTRVEEASGDTTRISVTSYDDSGRQRSLSTTITGGKPGDSNVPTQTINYGPNGLPTEISAGQQDIVQTYDSWGRVSTYRNALGVTSTTTYDSSGRPKTFNDGGGLYTYGYETSGEKRDLPTRISFGSANSPDVFLMDYTAGGSVASVTYPNGIVATRTYDSGDDIPTGLSYTQGGTSILSFTATPSVSGAIRSTRSPVSQQLFGYDYSGRLTKVEDVRDGECTTRLYGFTESSNRASMASYPDLGEEHQCTIASTAVGGRTSEFDSADRIVDSGYTHDALGRTRSIPASDLGETASGPLSIDYYANDMVSSMTLSVSGQEVRRGYDLDPLGRVSTLVSEVDGAESSRVRYKYSDAGDSPAIVETSADAGSSWSTRRYVRIPGVGLAATVDGGQTPILQLPNLHGDIAAVAQDVVGVTTMDSYREYDEYGNVVFGKEADRYGWLGSEQRSNEGLGGLLLMGARAYNPETGLFTSPDPVPGANANPYTYPVDPVNYSDTSGAVPLPQPGRTFAQIAYLRRIPLSMACPSLRFLCFETAGEGHMRGWKPAILRMAIAVFVGNERLSIARGRSRTRRVRWDRQGPNVPFVARASENPRLCVVAVGSAAYPGGVVTSRGRHCIRIFAS